MHEINETHVPPPSGRINSDGASAAEYHDSTEDCISCEQGEESDELRFVCVKCGAGTEPSSDG